MNKLYYHRKNLLQPAHIEACVVQPINTQATHKVIGVWRPKANSVKTVSPAY